ncbi:MAG: ATP-binding protein [Thermodesulfobacteriota bacterium]
MGLYISQQIAKAHGGDIAVASRPGEGSAFTVTIPKSGT